MAHADTPRLRTHLWNVALSRGWHPYDFQDNPLRLILPELDTAELEQMAADPIEWIRNDLQIRPGPPGANPDESGRLTNVSIRIDGYHTDREKAELLLLAALTALYVLLGCTIFWMMSQSPHPRTNE